MRHNIPTPNPAVVGLLMSPQMRELMADRAEVAQTIYRDIVAKRTGRLARSARVETFVGGANGDRWAARMIVDAPYAASHEYGTTVREAADDLNQVLNQLAAL